MKNEMKNYRLMIWMNDDARDGGFSNEYNPQTCEMSIRLGFENIVTKMERQPANNLDEVKEIALMEYSLWKPMGGCVEIVLDDKTIYHISEDSNHVLEKITIW